jgi:flagellar motility protein MotE (MotC chaperone)
MIKKALVSQAHARYGSAKSLMTRFLFLRLRLLPVVIFWSVLLLSVKVNNFWHHLKQGESPLEVREVFAKDPDPARPKDPGSQETPPPSHQASGVPAPKAAVDANTVDSMPLTHEQFQTLMQLSERQKATQAKIKDQLPKEKAMLGVLEKKISDRTKSLEATQKSLTDLLNSVQQKENDNTQRLVKMVEGMKPKDASARLEEMDFESLVNIMEKIKPKTAAAILANMAPEKAGYLMSELSKRREILKKENSSMDAGGVVAPQNAALEASKPQGAQPAPPSVSPA